MYIEKIEIENFRMFGEKREIYLQNGINMIIGENNSGKTAIIDAIRLVMSIGLYKRILYMEEEDFHINKYGIRANECNISIYFNDLSDDEQGELISIINPTIPDSKKAEIHVKYSLYETIKGIKRVREEVKGGTGESITERECLQKLSIVYMPALRNVENDLKPSKNGQIARLLLKIANTDEKRNKLIEIVGGMNKKILENDSVRKIEDTINQNLKNIEKEILQQKVSIGISEPQINEIASIIKLTNQKELETILISEQELKQEFLDKGIEYENISKYIIKNEENYVVEINSLLDNIKEISSNAEMISFLMGKNKVNYPIKKNGLGYNNILSISTEVSNITIREESDDYTLMLIEEPEAHLHPQLLYLLNDFLMENDSFQIILTSHSPTLISKFDLSKLIILNYEDNNVKITNLSKVNFEDGEKEELERYLDVTKSQMFFARGILFVEGISEALLINQFAKSLGRDLNQYAVEIVNIDGVNFEPFMKVFQKKEKDNLLDVKCSILTDDDRCTNQDDEYVIKKDDIKSFSSVNNFEEIDSKLKKGTISNRASNIKKYDKDNMKVELAMKTFEYELARIENNQKIILEVMQLIHPSIAKKIESDKENGIDKDIIATEIWIAIKDDKVEFAQKLLKKLTDSEEKIEFVVPQYIVNAIEHVTEKIIKKENNSNEIK